MALTGRMFLAYNADNALVLNVTGKGILKSIGASGEVPTCRIIIDGVTVWNSTSKYDFKILAYADNASDGHVLNPNLGSSTGEKTSLNLNLPFKQSLRIENVTAYGGITGTYILDV